jgi:hypothetical protein
MRKTMTSTASLWATFELSFDGPTEGNPFRDVTLGAVFEQGDRKVRVNGFYDGDGKYVVRFLPDATGPWNWATSSNAPALDGKSGTVEVGPAEPGHHGPVRVDRRHHFRYADGTRYINIGTTAYVWNLQGDAVEEQTLRTLAEAPFTKIRMCVFPKHYRYNEVEPERYPFKLLKMGDHRWQGKFEMQGFAFDFDVFDPAYFRHLERRINDLAAIGVEADLIIFHPYDRWGFSRMSPEQDDNYLRYLVARLAAFPNVWWSMANEYDFMFNKTAEDWRRWIDIVAANDPYGHLLGVHNGFPFYDHSHPKITHASIQRPSTERSMIWRERYGKPVSLDEVCYEGDIAEAWGNISGRELVHRFWKGTVNGGYVTHGETFYNDSETLWWAKGGKLVGESVRRIAFLKRILEQGPDEGLDPVKSTGFYQIEIAGGLDHADLRKLIAPFPGEESWPRAGTHFATAGQPHRYYLSYFGENQPGEVQAAVPPDELYDAILIDTWEMTETPIASGVVRGQILRFKAKPYQALLLRRAD